MNSQVSKQHHNVVAAQPSTVFNHKTSSRLLWQALAVLLLLVASVVPGAAQGIYVSNNPYVGVNWTYQAYIREYTLGGVPKPFLATMPAKSWVDGFALFGPTLRVPYTNPNTDLGTVKGYSATDGSLDGPFNAFPPALFNPVASAVLGGHLFVLYGYGIGEYDATTGSPSTVNPLLGTYLGNYIAASPGPGSTVNLFVTVNNGRPNNGYIQEINVDPSLGTVNSSGTRTFAHGLNFPQGIAVSEDGQYVYVVVPNAATPNLGEIDKYDTTTGLGGALVQNISGTPWDIAVHGSNLLVTLRDDNAIAEYDATNGNQIYLPPVTGLQFPTGIAVTPGDGTTFCTPPPSNMVAWYSFDQNLPGGVQYDLAKGNDAIAYGTQSVAGKVSNALHFDGHNDDHNQYPSYAEAPSTSLNNIGTSDFSVDAWVKIDPNDYTGSRVIVDKREGTLSTGWVGYSFFLYNGRLALQLADAPFSYSNYLSWIFVPTVGWQHIAVTVDRTLNVGTWYLNGTPSGTFNPSGHPGSLSNSAPLEIGAIEKLLTVTPDRRWFNGDMDEVEIFNKALRADEVQKIYSAGSAGKCK